MPTLINAYATHRSPPELGFPHQLRGRRDRSDPELAPHLQGFAGHLLNRAEGQMTRSLYHVRQHLQRVQHHLSLELESAELAAFAQWAWKANAILWLPDGSLRDPDRRVILDADGREPDIQAQVPYPPDAVARKARNDGRLQELGVQLPADMPPVISEVEVDLRPPAEVALRALALFVVALRAESLATGEGLEAGRLRSRMPSAFEALSPREAAFMEAALPEPQAIAQAAWRYEALHLLQWALGLAGQLSLPDSICDIPGLAQIMVDRADQMVGRARLRPTGELLDALDLHYRIHWAVRQARLTGTPAPLGLDTGVVQERHHALNWLTRFEDCDWDEVTTPT